MWEWLAGLGVMVLAAWALGAVLARREGWRRAWVPEERGKVIPFEGWWDQTVDPDPGEAGDGGGDE